MALWRADLHVHTVLSGCAEVEMIPPLLLDRCRQQGLHVMGVVDHNSAGNAEAAVTAAEGSDVVVKPGLEVESRETVHLLCLFDEVAQAQSLQRLVYEHLPTSAPAASAQAFGPQMLVDSSGAFLRYEQRPLFAATDLPAAEIARAARDCGGLVLAAHAERPAHGLLGVLGFPPPDLGLDGMEAGPGPLAAGRVASSDAHRLSEIGSRYTVFDSDSVTVEQLRKTLASGAFRTGVTL